MVAEWVTDLASHHLAERARIQLIDLADFDLPLLNEPVPAAFDHYTHDKTRAWAQTIEAFDGFIFVVPEYNHSMPAAVKNAIDFLFAEWNNKAAGFVSYGLHGGVRAVEHLRLTLAEVKVACVRSQVALSLFTDFSIDDITEPGELSPAEHHEPTLRRMLDELAEWSSALRVLRTTP